MMKKKKIMIITIMLSFLLVTVTALAMQSFSEKTVNDVPQPVQNSIGVNSNMTPSIVRSAVLPGRSTISGENEENKELILGQTYTEINPDVAPSIVRSAVLPESSTISSENEENKKPILEQTYTEVNPNVRSVMPWQFF